MEINESKFGEYLHRKITMFVSINMCVHVDGHWVFGGIERGIVKFASIIIIFKRALKPLEVTVSNIPKPFPLHTLKVIRSKHPLNSLECTHQMDRMTQCAFLYSTLLSMKCTGQRSACTPCQSLSEQQN